MKVIKVNSLREFEVDGEISVGSFVLTDNIIGVSTTIYHQEEELTKYLSKGDMDMLRSFLPDISEPKYITRCYALMDTKLENPKNLPKIGSDVEILDDDSIKKIHIKNGELYIPYLPFLIKKDIDVSRRVVTKLIELFPEYRDVLEIILAEIEFRLIEEVDL